MLRCFNRTWQMDPKKSCKEFGSPGVGFRTANPTLNLLFSSRSPFARVQKRLRGNKGKRRKSLRLGGVCFMPISKRDSWATTMSPQNVISTKQKSRLLVPKGDA